MEQPITLNTGTLEISQVVLNFFKDSKEYNAKLLIEEQESMSGSVVKIYYVMITKK